MYLLPVSIICARLYYCIFQGSFENFLNFRTGGLAIYGGIIGAIATIFVYCKIKRLNFLDMLDYIAPYLALGQAIGRWGNFVNIEAYGTETSLPWRMGIYEGGIYTEVHPAFLYESIATFLIFLILFKIRNKRRYKGQITFLYLALYGAARFFIEGVRIDSLMLNNVRISQVLALSNFVVFGSILLYKSIKMKKSAKNVEL